MVAQAAPQVPVAAPPAVRHAISLGQATVVLHEKQLGLPPPVEPDDDDGEGQVPALGKHLADSQTKPARQAPVESHGSMHSPEVAPCVVAWQTP